MRFAAWPTAPLEVAEGLEQLRAMHNGMKIRVAAMAGEADGGRGHARRPGAGARPDRRGTIGTEASLPTKYIFVTGGVVSSLGKGLASASIGCLLEGHGFRSR